MLSPSMFFDSEALSQSSSNSALVAAAVQAQINKMERKQGTKTKKSNKLIGVDLSFLNPFNGGRKDAPPPSPQNISVSESNNEDFTT